MKIKAVFNVLCTIVRICKNVLYQNVALNRWRKSVHLFLAWNPFRLASRQKETKYLTGIPTQIVVEDYDKNLGNLGNLGNHHDCQRDFLNLSKIEDKNESCRRNDKYGMNYECDFCLKRFETKMKVRRHSNVHTHVKLFCTWCPEEFSQRSKLDDHCLKVHRKRNASISN